MKFALAMLLLALSAAAAEEELPPGGGNRSLRLGAGVALSSVNTSPFLAGSVAVTPSFTIGAAFAFRTTPSPLDSATLHADLRLARGFGVTAEGGTYSYLGSTSSGGPFTGYGGTFAAGMVVEFPLSDTLLLFTRRPWFRPPMGNLTNWALVDFNDEVFTVNLDGNGKAWSAGLPLGALLTLTPELDVAFRTGFRTISYLSASPISIPLAFDALLHLTDSLDAILDVTLPAAGGNGTTSQFSVVFQTRLGTKPPTTKPIFSPAEPVSLPKSPAEPVSLPKSPAEQVSSPKSPAEPVSSPKSPRPLLRFIDRPLVLPKGEFLLSGAVDAGYLSSGSGASGQSASFLLAALDAGIVPRLELGAVVAVKMDASDRRIERGGGRGRFEVTDDLALQMEGSVYAYQTSPFVDSRRGVAAGAGVIWAMPLDVPWVLVSIGRLLGSPPLPGRTSGSSIVLPDHIATIDTGGPGGTEITIGVPLAVTIQATDRIGFALRSGYRYQSIAGTPSGHVARHSVPLAFDAALALGTLDLIGTLDFVPQLMRSTAQTGTLYEGRLAAQWTF